MTYDLDSKQDFERYMLDFYTALFPSGRMQVYNTHIEKMPDGSTVSVANIDKSWSDMELPILLALHATIQDDGRTLYETNLQLYTHNYTPRGLPLQSIFIQKPLEERVFALEREVAISKST
jgi:hypothetical protein